MYLEKHERSKKRGPKSRTFTVGIILPKYGNRPSTTLTEIVDTKITTVFWDLILSYLF